MFRISDLRRKDIVNVNSGCKMGAVRDIEVDMAAGKVCSLIIPGGSRLWGFFWRREETVIPWEQIKKIGQDVVLVDAACTDLPDRRNMRSAVGDEDWVDI